MKNKIGVIGLGVMGSALARNIAGKNIPVSVYNRTPEKTKSFIEKFAEKDVAKNAEKDAAKFAAKDVAKNVEKFSSKNLRGFLSMKEFVESLEEPRKIILMIPAGAPVDEAIQKLLPHLKKSDVLMDGGNSFYKDTERRCEELKKKNIVFLGTGISGGEKGALEGPSLMPGGEERGWKIFEPFLKKIAAKDFQGKPCVSYLGKGGNGHFVKMVHNGIEYAFLELVAESYAILKNIGGFKNIEIAEIFKKWNQGKLNSYILEMAEEVLRKKDPFSRDDLVDRISDVAGQKGTGAWTALEGIGKSAAVNMITESVFVRFISSEEDLRKEFSKYFGVEKISKKKPQNMKKFLGTMENGLYAGILIAYMQGILLLKKHDKNLNIAEIARLWQGGCIIRAALLKNMEIDTREAKQSVPSMNKIAQELKKELGSLKEVLRIALENDLATPCFSAAWQYMKLMTAKKLPTNLLQGIRDYFGGHGFRRTDREGEFHI